MSQTTAVAPEPLPPFEPERAQATLEWLRRQSPTEQRATFEYWQRALGETANGEGHALGKKQGENNAAIGIAIPSQPIPPMDVENARQALKPLVDFDRDEHRETFESLQQALEEMLQAEPATLPAPEAANPNHSGMPLPPFDPARAIAALRVLRQGDPAEHRETYEFLKKALNEERAAHGERLLFVDDDE